jgi:hypothetical protein
MSPVSSSIGDDADDDPERIPLMIPAPLDIQESEGEAAQHGFILLELRTLFQEQVCIDLARPFLYAFQ